MTPVYQTIVAADKGNCMTAAVASLLDQPIESIPYFRIMGREWFSSLVNTFYKNGCIYQGCLYNANRELLKGSNTNNLQKFPKNLTETTPGLNGYYYATVYSPKFFDPTKITDFDYTEITHAVIIDANYNIVHDPNPNNQGVKYPLADELGFNGVLEVYMFEPDFEQLNF